ncbi:FG-GAP-like repeat-containing protein [Pirellulaceae bacterium SH449]
MAKLSDGQTSARWPKLVVTSAALAVVVLGVLIFFLPPPEDSFYTPETYLRAAEESLAAGRFEDSVKFVSLIESTSELRSRACLVAGEALTKLGDLDQAIKFYEEISSSHPEIFPIAQYALAEIFRVQSRWQESLACYLNVLTINPNQAESRERVAFLLGISGQRWESVPHLMKLVELQRWDLQTLSVLTDIERPIEQRELVAESFKSQPNDLVVRLARTHHFMVDGDPQTARPILESLAKNSSAPNAVFEMLGEAIYQMGDAPALEAWNRALPASLEKSPSVWFIRGQQARIEGELEIAAICYSKAIAIVPEYRLALYQLGQVLTKLGDENAKEVIERAKLQAETSQQLDLILGTNGQSPIPMQKVSDACTKLGRFREAWAWAVTSRGLHGESTWTMDMIQRAKPFLERNVRTAETSQSVQSAVNRYAAKAQNDPLKAMKWADVNRAVQEGKENQSLVRFEQEDKIGLDFIYQNGDDPATPGVRMFEQTGGGVAVLDFDNDGWPDLYFTQGSPWISGEANPTSDPKHHDTLFRNMQGQSYKECSALSGILVLDYSQGVTVGDLDNDGFDDIFVGVIGRSRLYMNNGDGTFRDETASLLEAQDSWTTSAVIVDLNGDSLPDIFELNYLEGEQIYTLICNGKGCSPSNFSGAVNRCWLNKGDGSFEFVENCDGPPQASKSLGVLAMRLEGEQTNSLFIANDQVPNFLLVPSKTSDGKFALEDEALLRGLALNMDGLSMACMGIAADDLDNSGSLDLLVTNFSNEANSVYLQDSTGLFTDSTLAAGMQTASYPYVGWGTQFLDADRDGNPDVVVVNGHVDDYRDRGGEYAMLPQFYRNNGRGRLSVVPGEEIGSFFTTKHLSRALAKLDWNRDGLVDFVVSNILEPSMLVSNRTQNAGRYLNVRMIGTESPRIPIGAIVTVVTDAGEWTKQLTAGDGYQCSNERVIQFGLGSVDSINKLTIQWPSGRISEHLVDGINTEIMCVEGQP